MAARSWRPKAETSKVDIAAALVKQLALWHRDRTIHVVADAAYHGPALRHLPSRITVTTRLPASAVLYDLAPPPTGERDRPRLEGARLGKPDDLAKTAKFDGAKYGLTCAAAPIFDSRRRVVAAVSGSGSSTGFDANGWGRAVVRSASLISTTIMPDLDPLDFSAFPPT